MAGIGLGIAWVGYWSLYYGITQIQGQNYGFLDLGLPSKWATVSKNPPITDQGAPSSSSKPSVSISNNTAAGLAIGSVVGSPNAAIGAGLSAPGGTQLVSPLGSRAAKAATAILRFLGL